GRLMNRSDPLGSAVPDRAATRVHGGAGADPREQAADTSRTGEGLHGPRRDARKSALRVSGAGQLFEGGSPERGNGGRTDPPDMVDSWPSAGVPGRHGGCG